MLDFSVLYSLWGRMQRATLAFLQFFLLLACLLQSKGGLAFPSFGNEAAEVARLHCQLLLKQAGDTQPLTEELIDTMVGIKDFHLLLGAPPQQLAQFTGEAPDMGFVIGGRWAVMDRWERIKFNTLFSKMLIHQYSIQNTQSYANTCPMNARLLELEPATLSAEKEEKEENIWEGQEVWPRSMAAFASTQLAMENGEKLDLTYYLEKHPPDGWEIKEITLGKTELSQNFSSSFNGLLAAGGAAELFEELGDSGKSDTKP